MITYCLRDVEITAKLYELFLKYINSKEWREAIELEHRCAIYCEEMHRNGFSFDLQSCTQLHTDICLKLKDLDEEIKRAFPPRSKLVREITPSITKHGTLHRKDFKWIPLVDGRIDLTPYSDGATFSLIEFEEFNPGSVKQIVERLNEAGWKPTDRTKGHIEHLKKYQRAPKSNRQKLKERLDEYAIYGWTISEENLRTLPDDAPKPARTLTQRLLLDRRRSTLEEWINAYNKGDGSGEPTGRIHGKFSSIGSWTHRLSHSEPNQANIVRIVTRKDSEGNDIPIPGFEGGYGLEFRQMWQAAPGKVLVDVDAEGIQLRILAHYMDDPKFTEALVNGSSKDGTDVHTLNQRALGDVCGSRAVAKTFIYSWLLGAGPGKTASILGCSLAEAKSARDRFLEFYPRLDALRKETIPRDASRGYFVGIDGRKVLCNSEHLMLSGYLQNGEAVLMKKALDIWHRRLTELKIPFTLVDFVHDEFVCETEEGAANDVMEIMKDSIRIAGEYFNLKCPHSGNGHIGHTWADVH